MVSPWTGLHFIIDVICMFGWYRVSFVWVSWWRSTCTFLIVVLKGVVHTHLFSLGLKWLTVKLWLRRRHFLECRFIIIVVTIIISNVRLPLWSLYWVRRVFLRSARARRFVRKRIIMGLLFYLVCARKWGYSNCWLRWLLDWRLSWIGCICS